MSGDAERELLKDALLTIRALKADLKTRDAELKARDAEFEASGGSTLDAGLEPVPGTPLFRRNPPPYPSNLSPPLRPGTRGLDCSR